MLECTDENFYDINKIDRFGVKCQRGTWNRIYPLNKLKSMK